MILYILLSGYPPFFGSTDARIFEKIRSCTYDFKRPEWNSVSEAAKDLIRNLLVLDPRNRFTIEQALSHPWIASNEAIPDTELQLDLHDLEEFTNGSRLRKAVLLCIASQCNDSDIKSLRDVFVKLDSNGDGTLSLAELQTGISMLPNINIQMEELMK